MPNIVLEAKNLGKTYSEGNLTTPVFSDLQLSVKAGENRRDCRCFGCRQKHIAAFVGGLDSAKSGELSLLANTTSRLRKLPVAT